MLRCHYAVWVLETKLISVWVTFGYSDLVIKIYPTGRTCDDHLGDMKSYFSSSSLIEWRIKLEQRDPFFDSSKHPHSHFIPRFTTAPKSSTPGWGRGWALTLEDLWIPPAYSKTFQDPPLGSKLKEINWTITIVFY